MHKTVKREWSLWAQAAIYTIKGIVAFGIGLGLTLALVAAALANQASLHEQFCHPVDCVANGAEALLVNREAASISTSFPSCLITPCDS